MELRHLRSFLSLAEELHFGRAADRLGISQSVLSRQLQQLETAFGAQLVDRTSRSVRLTVAGASLQQRVEPHVEALEQALQETQLIARARSGRLRVGFVANLSYVFLPNLLSRLRAHAPDANFEAHEMPTPRQIESLNAQRVDVGIAVAPLDDLGLMQRKVFSENWVVMMPDTHPLTRSTALRLGSLAREPFVICPRYVRTGLHEAVLQRCAAAGFKPRIAQEVGGRSLLEELVAAGVGISLLPASASKVPRTGVAFRPVLGKVEPLDVHVIWRAENENPLLRLFLDSAVSLAAEFAHEELHKPGGERSVVRRVRAA